MTVGSVIVMTMIAIEDMSRAEIETLAAPVQVFFSGVPQTSTSLHQKSSTSMRRSIQASTSTSISKPVSVAEEPPSCEPRPQHIQEMVNARATDNKKMLIYFHKGPEMHLPLEDMYFPGGQKYKCFQCEYTTDESRAVEADAVVILYRKKLEYKVSNVTRIPPKYCGQLFVMLQTECPNNIDPLLTPEEKYRDSRIFDVSSTYRLDSDLPRPYVMNVRDMLDNAKKNYIPLERRDSEFPVAWIASRCDSPNDRMEYVEELMKHIGVKSYGECLNNAKINVPREAKNWNQGADDQIGHHKFYLSFENSNCDYYVTEKMYRPLKLGVIPVIMGAPQTHQYLPNNHSAIHVSDFKSPAELAKRLHEINKDDSLFESYTSFIRDPQEIDTGFKNRWLRKRPPHACQLCNLVRTSFRENLRGVKYDDWVSCEQKHGTWKTDFKPMAPSAELSASNG